MAMRWVCGAVPFKDMIDGGSGGEPFALIPDDEHGYLVLTKSFEEVEGDKSSTRPENTVVWDG